MGKFKETKEIMTHSCTCRYFSEAGVCGVRQGWQKMRLERDRSKSQASGID